MFHHISLVAFLAWVGLGANGLSSSAYGPDEAFRAILGHEYLASYLAVVTAVTVGVISFSYSLPSNKAFTRWAWGRVNC